MHVTVLTGFQVLLLGDASVGKTSIRSQFVHHRFSAAYRATMGCDFLTSRVEADEPGLGTVGLQVWDTAGQERFNSLGFSFYRGADVAVLVYDMTNAESFQNLSKWVHSFHEHCMVREPILLLVGNKSDKMDYRVISFRQAKEFCEEHFNKTVNSNVDRVCLETSAKDDVGIRVLFKRIATLVAKRQQENPSSFEVMDSTIEIDQPKQSTKCC
jgi:Ras-related protein Rab-7A